MTAYRTIDDHKELDNVGVNTHDDIDIHVDTTAFIVASGTSNVPADARILTPGPNISFLDGGPGGSFVISVSGSLTSSPGGANASVQFNDSGSLGGVSTFTFDKSTDTLAVVNLSGSLTQLSDGTSYLIAGENVTIVTGTNGSITINSTATGGGGSGDSNASYLVLSTTSSLGNERAFVASTGLLSSDGGPNGNYTLTINDAVVATVSGTTFTGATRHDAGISGSLTRLTDGASYLVAGPGISIVSQSNGSILITGSTQVIPGGADTYIQFNDGGNFGGDSGLTYDKNTDTLSGINVILSGDLTVNGTTVTVNTTNLEVKDSVIGLGFSSGTIAETSGDRGIIGGISGNDNVTFLWKDAQGEFVFGRTQSSATGSLPIPLTQYSNIHAANIQGSIVTASLGFSGSLTRLSDGTSYLIAGGGITITSASNGSVTITGNLGDITSVTAGIGLLGGGNSGDVTLDINDSVVATISGSTFTGVTSHNAGLSGSLTRLTDGTSYLSAGTNINIVSSSNGSITISAPGLASTSSAYVTIGNDSDLTNERALTAGTGLTLTDAGANSTVTLGINDSVVATISGSTFTGAVNFNAGLSGSLTQLIDGTSYLIAGPGISIVSQSNGSILITGSTQVTPGGLDTYVQFNDGGTLGGDSTFTFNKNTDSLTVTNLSGSLTHLSDGTSYLIAGNNITITTGSNGAVTINSTATGGGGSGDPDATYLVLSTTGSLSNERAFVASTGLLASDAGPNGNYTLSINDSVVATLSGSTFTGAVNFNAGLSGSLTQLVDGSSYLIAGTNVTIASSSNGPITISATAGAAVPGGSDTQVQFNDSNAFGGDANFTFNKTTNTLTVDNISGSLTRLIDGTSYLVAGTNVVITTGSNGSVTISAPTANQISLMSWMEVPTGDVDGVNMVYTLAYNPSPTNSLMFYVNGVLQKQGLAHDYDLSSNTVIMNYAPQTGSNVIATYAYVTTPPVGTYTSWMEIPGGLADGANTTFTLANAPWPSSALMLYINGVLQKQGGVNDYTLSSSIISMNYAPQTGSNVIATYPY